MISVVALLGRNNCLRSGAFMDGGRSKDFISEGERIFMFVGIGTLSYWCFFDDYIQKE